MTEDTLLRIREAIAILGFRPNRIARALVTRSTSTVALLISEIETPLFLQAVTAIEPIARAAGYNVLLCNAASLTDEQEALLLLVEKQVDGIIFLSISEYRDDRHLIDIQASGVPLVLINRSTAHAAWDQVRWDNCTGVTDAVDHLVRSGHHRIALLRGPLNRRSCAERLHGYRLGLQRNGIPYCDDYVRTADYTADPETWQRSVQELLALAERPTAIIASDDNVAAVTLRTAQHAGLHVPCDLSVVGFDDQPSAAFLSPALTTIRCPIQEGGRHAIRMLLERIADPGKPPANIVLPCNLVLRESVSRPGAPEPVSCSEGANLRAPPERATGWPA